MWIAIIAVCGCYPFLTLLTGIHKCGSHFRESVDHLEALEQYFFYAVIYYVTHRVLTFESADDIQMKAI